MTQTHAQVMELQDRRRRLGKRLEQIEREVGYGVFRGDPDEAVRVRKAIARIGKKLKRGIVK